MLQAVISETFRSEKYIFIFLKDQHFSTTIVPHFLPAEFKLNTNQQNLMIVGHIF